MACPRFTFHLESESADARRREEAARALDQIRTDRAAVGGRIARTTPWYAPAFALLAAVAVWSPAAGSLLASVLLLAFVSAGLLALEALRLRATGLQLAAPRRAAGWIVLTAIVVVFIAAYASSFLLVVAGAATTSIVVAIAALVLLALGGWTYDRIASGSVAGG
jgi:hypothetical protein